MAVQVLMFFQLDEPGELRAAVRREMYRYDLETNVLLCYGEQAQT